LLLEARFVKPEIHQILFGDPLGVLKRSPDLLAAIRGPASKLKRGGRKKGRGRKEEGREYPLPHDLFAQRTDEIAH